MLRRLSNLASALSLLLCLGSGVLWLRSWRVGDAFWITTASADYSGLVGGGRVWVARHAGRGTRSFSHASVRPPPHPATPDDAPGRLGFFYDDRTSADGGARLSLVFPIWSAALPAAVLPALRLIALLRTRRRRATGRCARCGYDLRATPDLCPECGAPVPIKQAAE